MTRRCHPFLRQEVDGILRGPVPRGRLMQHSLYKVTKSNAGVFELGSLLPRLSVEEYCVLDLGLRGDP